MQRARRSSWWRGLTIVGLVAAGLLGVASSASAASVGDEAALRSAVADSSATAITLSADISLTCGGGGALVRNSSTPLFILGARHWINQTCAGDDLIDVAGSGGLTLSGVALGGAGSTVVSDDAPVTVDSTLILGGDQYAIDTASGTVSVSGSYIFNGHVAGIHSAGAAVTVTDTGMSSGGSAIVSDGELILVRANIANAGADGIVANGPATIANSTILFSRGNGIVAGGPTTVVYSSVALNAVYGNPGVNLAFGGPNGSYTVQNSVISRHAYFLGQPFPAATAANCAAGPVTSAGYNLADDPTCPFSEASDLPQGADPLLGLAAVPPGSLFSALIPQPGSPLINAIPGSVCQAGAAAGITSDEFGNPRPGPAGGCDVGAYQTQGADTPPTTTPAAVVLPPRFTG